MLDVSYPDFSTSLQSFGFLEPSLSIVQLGRLGVSPLVSGLAQAGPLALLRSFACSEFPLLSLHISDSGSSIFLHSLASVESSALPAGIT